MKRHRLRADVVTASNLKLLGYTAARKDTNARPQGAIVEKGARLNDKSNVSSPMLCMSTANGM